MKGQKKRKDYNCPFFYWYFIDIFKNDSPLSKLYVLEMISDQYFMFCSLIFLVFSILLVARAPTCLSYSSWLISLMTVCFNSKVKQGWLIYKVHLITLLFFYALHNQLKGSILKSNEVLDGLCNLTCIKIQIKYMYKFLCKIYEMCI